MINLVKLSILNALLFVRFYIILIKFFQLFSRL